MLFPCSVHPWSNRLSTPPPWKVVSFRGVRHIICARCNSLERIIYDISLWCSLYDVLCVLYNNGDIKFWLSLIVLFRIKNDVLQYTTVDQCITKSAYAGLEIIMKCMNINYNKIITHTI